MFHGITSMDLVKLTIELNEFERKATAEGKRIRGVVLSNQGYHHHALIQVEDAPKATRKAKGSDESENKSADGAESDA